MKIGTIVSCGFRPLDPNNYGRPVFDVVVLFTRVNTASTNNDSLRCLGAAAKGRLFSAKTERYFYHDDRRPLYLLLVYAKGRQENLTPDKKKAVRKLTALLKQ